MKKPPAVICGMTRTQLIDQCRELYKKEGPEALLFQNLKKNESSYFRLYRFGITQRTLLKKLGVEEEFLKYRKSRYGWTWGRIINKTKPIVKKMGFLPPAGWFQKNDYSSIVAAVYSLKKTWNDLRLEFDSYKGSSFVESRNGMRWRSYPEASLSNFLYARGIKQKLGSKYPERFAKYAGQKYGYYDLSFLDRKSRWVDVEIWGDKPKGHNEKGYAKKRKIKERFNINNKKFVGIDFQDCFDEERLALIMKRFIGRKKPYIFEKPFDREVQSTHWSNADELIVYCKHLVKGFPGGKFPTEDWLRKRGRWKDRKGVAYNTLSVYIKTWLGGVRKLRQILGQPELSTVKWDRKTALAEYKKWHGKYGCTPGSALARFRRGEKFISKDEANHASRIREAVANHVGSDITACEVLGIEHQTRWNRRKVLREYRNWLDKFKFSPQTALYRSRQGKMNLSNNEADQASRLGAAVQSHIGGHAKACRSLRIKLIPKWNKKKVLAEYKKWYSRYHCSPMSIYGRFRKGRPNISQAEAEQAVRLSGAAQRYFGSITKIHELTGI
jgi:hypothetical protein